jgi:hypothetical protein
MDLSALRERLAAELAEKLCLRTRLFIHETSMWALVLHFGCEMWIAGVNLEPSVERIWINSVWRLRQGPRVLAGIYDRPDLVVSNLELLAGKRLIRTTIDEGSGDLTIEFTDDLMIETFTDSVTEQDCHWEYQHAIGFRMGIDATLSPYERTVEPDELFKDYSG